MIRHTFSILQGIGEKLERRLWREGTLTWDDFIGSPGIDFISPERKHLYDGLLSASSRELDSGNASYFSRSVGRREHWRLYDAFKGEALCLDIETNGLAPEAGGYATAVGIYDGFDYRCLVRGNGLNPDNLRKELSAYKYLITFFGSAFDIPFLARSMPGLRFEMPHFDLCFGSKRAGLKGGLKKLESAFGIERDSSVRGMDGYDAVRLWEYARGGSKEALELLITYNREDTVNLFKMAGIIYDRLRSQTGIEKYL